MTKLDEFITIHEAARLLGFTAGAGQVDRLQL